MRFRTLALALTLALGSGTVATIHAAGKDKAAKQNAKYMKKLNKQRSKQSKAAKVKPRKAKKTKHA